MAKRVVKTTAFDFAASDGDNVIMLTLSNDNEQTCVLTVNGTDYGISDADALEMPKAFRVLNKESGRFVSTPRGRKSAKNGQS